MTAPDAGSGPIYVGVLIEFSNDVTNRNALAPSEWVRGDTAFGHRDAWGWNGKIELGLNDHLLVMVRNDSGSTARWMASWGTSLD